jgi:hypothetical protein
VPSSRETAYLAAGPHVGFVENMSLCYDGSLTFLDESSSDGLPSVACSGA